MVLITLVLLILMEISLSFDNAVLNAQMLQKMSKEWRQRFITWGIPIAVFGMRLVFPIAIVSISTGLSMVDVTELAFGSPEEYARHLTAAHVGIAAFGGFFLLMIFLKFLFEREKEVHWIKYVEEKLNILGRLEAVEISIALGILLAIQFFIPVDHHSEFLVAGMFGIFLHILINSLMGCCESGAKQGLMGFIYLEALDASCSLDGVIGAFVLTNDIVLIMIGLGVGALAVRSLTIYLVRGGQLAEYRYLGHGANWGIGALATIMLVSIFTPVPEIITGIIGVGFIGLSLLSSIKENRK